MIKLKPYVIGGFINSYWIKQFQKGIDPLNNQQVGKWFKQQGFWWDESQQKWRLLASTYMGRESGITDFIRVGAKINDWAFRAVTTMPISGNADYIKVTASLNSYALLQGQTINRFTDAIDTDQYTLTFSTSWKLINPQASDFEIFGEDGFNFIPTGISKVNDYTWALAFEDYTQINPFPEMDILLNCYAGANEAGTAFSPFEITFTSVNLAPDPALAGPPTVEEVWNE